MKINTYVALSFGSQSTIFFDNCEVMCRSERKIVSCHILSREIVTFCC